MARFGGVEDWGLQAIFGGSDNMVMMETSDQPCSLGTSGMEQNDESFLFSFSDHFAESSMLLDDGLEALYKPFYPVFDSASTQPCNVLVEKESENDVEEIPKKQEPMEKPVCPPSSRKRKNQQKRVVNKVKAEDLSSDMWAWRKYGQKPIRGSHYPRSYYRCSSMKGCPARKQVEQSCTDPGVYIVTYKEEHCHSQPTRRSSLAGTVRQKFPRPNESPTAGGSLTNRAERVKKDSNYLENEIVSPTNRRIMESFEGESNVKHEKLHESEDQILQGGYTNINEFYVSDFLMNDTLFSGLLEVLDY